MKRLFFCLILLAPITLFADTQAVAILLDTSKSIPPDQFSKGKKIIEKFIQTAGPNDNVNAYAFGNSLRKIDSGAVSAVEANDSYTRLYDAAIDVARELDKIPAERKAIVFITDGIDAGSATIIDDAMSFADERAIAIHSIGVGKVNNKSLERIAKLTGGRVFELNSPKVVEELRSTIANQKSAAAAQPPSPVTTTPPPVAQSADPDPVATQQPPVTKPPAVPGQQKRQTGLMTRYGYLLWIAGAGLIAVPIVLWVVTRAFKKETRTCPTCGKPLEDYQTVCPDCTATPQPVATKPVEEEPALEMTQQTRQIKRPQIPLADDLPSFPPEVLLKQPDSDELLSRTFVLMDKPLLIIRKGKNLGQAFTLDRSVPVSIGRSRVCEIRLEDTTVSGQHCRIISEDGKHYLYDLRSTNGTYVNDKKVRKVELKEGDIIKVGETYFLYKVEQQRS
ncbi:MAG TPA: FHA domain-containing protein [Acidobacteriota bacterium]|nr:FHA domain-containing protein [Acidobacteriota bacterium]